MCVCVCVLVCVRLCLCVFDVVIVDQGDIYVNNIHIYNELRENIQV